MDKIIKDNCRKYYEILELIGRGAFGNVYKAKNTNTDEIRALKIIDLLEEEEESNIIIDNITHQIKSARICSENNENSVKYYESFLTKREFVIVMELYDDDLDKVLRRKKEGFTPEEVYKIMIQLNHTFKIMKKNYIVHRDIKLSNILIKYKDLKKSDFIVALTDYDLSKEVSNYSLLRTRVGTILTMAPEIIEGKEKYGDKFDLWSIGIIIYQMLFQESPYKGKTEVIILNNIKNLGNKYLKKSNNNKLDDLIRKLLIENLKERISWEEYFKHPFFKDDLKNKKEKINDKRDEEIEQLKKKNY